MSATGNKTWHAAVTGRGNWPPTDAVTGPAAVAPFGRYAVVKDMHAHFEAVPHPHAQTAAAVLVSLAYAFIEH